MYKKPEISDNSKVLVNRIYKFLLQQNVAVKKEKLCELLGWEYNTSNDRRIRDLISILAELKPIVATSNQRGYYLAKSKEDLEKVEHQWKEFDSRIEKLEKRREPLIKFYEKMKGEKG